MIKGGQVYCDECGGNVTVTKWGVKTGVSRGGKVYCEECHDLLDRTVLWRADAGSIFKLLVFLTIVGIIASLITCANL